MGDMKAKGLNDLSDEQVDTIAGGFIVDRGEEACDSGARYAIVDDISGEMVGQAASFGDARAFALDSMSRGARTGKAVITLEEYEKIFGRPL